MRNDLKEKGLLLAHWCRDLGLWAMNSFPSELVCGEAKDHVRKLGEQSCSPCGNHETENRNRQGQYSLQKHAPSALFSPTRPQLSPPPNNGINFWNPSIHEVRALMIQSLSMIRSTNWAPSFNTGS